MLAKLASQLSASSLAMSTVYPKTSFIAFRNWVRVSRRNSAGAGVNAGGLTTMVFGSGGAPPVPPVELVPPLPVVAPLPAVPAEVVPPLPGAPDPPTPAGLPVEFPEPAGTLPTRPVQPAASTKAQQSPSPFLPGRQEDGFFILFSEIERATRDFPEPALGGRRPLRR